MGYPDPGGGGGRSEHPISVFSDSRSDSLLPSIYADERYIDAALVSQAGWRLPRLHPRGGKRAVSIHGGGNGAVPERWGETAMSAVVHYQCAPMPRIAVFPVETVVADMRAPLLLTCELHFLLTSSLL